MIASKGKPDAFSGKRSEKRDRTHKNFYFRDSMSRTRAVRQFRSDSAEGEQDSERLGLRGEPVRSVRLGGSRFCESVGAV